MRGSDSATRWGVGRDAASFVPRKQMPAMVQLFIIVTMPFDPQKEKDPICTRFQEKASRKRAS